MEKVVKNITKEKEQMFIQYKDMEIQLEEYKIRLKTVKNQKKNLKLDFTSTLSNLDSISVKFTEE